MLHLPRLGPIQENQWRSIRTVSPSKRKARPQDSTQPSRVWEDEATRRSSHHHASGIQRQLSAWKPGYVLPRCPLFIGFYECSSGVWRPHWGCLEFDANLNWGGMTIPKSLARKAMRLSFFIFVFFRFWFFCCLLVLFCLFVLFLITPYCIPWTGTAAGDSLDPSPQESAGPSHGLQGHQTDYDLENPWLLNTIVYSAEAHRWTGWAQQWTNGTWVGERVGAHFSSKATSVQEPLDSVANS